MRIKSLPFIGGAKISQADELALIPHGGYSAMQNMRNGHPGLFARPGYIKQHSTADSTNKVLSLFQFSKGKAAEKHTFAQMSDGDILEATTAPPGVTTGAFGSEVFDGSASQIPGSWAVVDDMVIHGNGVDDFKIWPGNTTPVSRFIVYKGGAAVPNYPQIGEDYSEEVSDGRTDTVAVLDSLGDLSADYDCIFIMTKVPWNVLTWTIPKPNGTAAVMLANYWKNTSAWASLTITDNTAASGKTLATTGATMTCTTPTDMIPHHLFGECGFWYQFYLDTGGDLDAEVEVSAVTFEANFQSIQNVWDGVPVDAIEAIFDDNSATTFYTYATTDVTVSLMTASDKVYFCSYDPIEAFYVDVGGTPNTTGTTTINAAGYFNGAAFAAFAAITDGTAGLSKSGWVKVPRVTQHPTQFQNTQYHAYWYYFTVDKTLSDDLSIGIQVRPYFDVTELGKARCVESWKNRAVYSFTLYPKDLYVSAENAPMVLNGEDFGILQSGDGRDNKVVACRKYKNELMVWQEEKGEPGGCLTLFEGYSPTTFGKLLISSRLGTMNNKSVDIVEGVLVTTKTESTQKDLAFCLSRYGVYICDGRLCWFIDGDIKNYFDPTDTNCIRRGYESEMWLKYDSAFNVVRVGLVTGASATVCNTFLVFDIETKTWSTDTYADALSCMTEVEAGSGTAPVVQIGGGTVYRRRFGQGLTDGLLTVGVNAGATFRLSRTFVVDVSVGYLYLFFDDLGFHSPNIRLGLGW